MSDGRPLLQVDAFSARPLQGNACAVLFDADDLDDDTMLAIAREMNLSETAFVMRSDAADFRARYFTPAEEIPLAGHPTIATAFALVETGRFRLEDDHGLITLELPAGIIPVEIEAPGGVVGRITMAQKKPEFLREYEPSDVLPAFGLSVDALLPGAPIQTVSTGTPQIMIPVRGLADLRGIRVDVAKYRALRERGDFFSPHLFCLEGVTPEGSTFARHFGVPPDTPEDPFTGSATGGMAAFLWRHGLIQEPSFVAEQGHWMHRPGLAWVDVVGPPDDIETVKVGGRAALVFEGTLFV